MCVQVTRAIHAATLDKRIRGGAQALVELQVEADGELHAALDSLGSELNDLFGVCATRLLVRAGRDGGGSEVAAAAPAGGEGGEIVGHFDGVIEAARAEVRIAIRVTDAPRCERCWRHVPEAAARSVEEGVELEGGWLYRGCPRDGAGVLCPVMDGLQL